MRLALQGIAVMACVLAGGARADDLVAVSPGVMCGSADALAKLTLPSGDSRTHRAPVRAEDAALAEAGGCIDILPGATVSVRQGFRNTSIVTYGADAATQYVVPNIDFAPAAASPVAATYGLAAPAGYAITQRLATAASDGDALVLMEDARITPALHAQMWGRSDDPDFFFGDDPARMAEFARAPFVKARLALVSAAGVTRAEMGLDGPLARVEPAPIHGLPAPAFLLTVDYSTGMGSYSGPATRLLMPSREGLRPVEYVPGPGDKGGPLVLAKTLKADWRIVAPRPGAGPVEEIEAASCYVGGSGSGDFVTAYGTYRFEGGAWRSTTRRQAGFWEAESFPPRSMFP